MNRVAVFGNAGGGKSTLARRLAEITGLPLYVLDILQFRDGRYRPEEPRGGRLDEDEYLRLHRDLLGRDRWIIDGFDRADLAWERFAAADTLVYVDLPLRIHYWRVTMRLIEGLLRTPPGWPQNSPVWESSMSSYRVIRLCERKLAPRYRQLVAEAAPSKRVHHLRCAAEVRALVHAVEARHGADGRSCAEPT